MDKSTSYDGFFATLRPQLGERAFRLCRVNADS